MAQLSPEPRSGLVLVNAYRGSHSLTTPLLLLQGGTKIGINETIRTQIVLKLHSLGNENVI